MISISARATRLPFLLPGRSVAAACLAWLSLGAADAQAQAPGPDCVSLVDDAQRLACYDRAHGRSSPVSAPGSRPDAVPTGAPTRASASAASSPAAGHAAPTSPAGGVGLGPRWDLDGERGELFAPRVHRSVYLLPVTWTDRVNRRPSSPSPDHSVTEDLQAGVAQLVEQRIRNAKVGCRFDSSHRHQSHRRIRRARPSVRGTVRCPMRVGAPGARAVRRPGWRRPPGRR
jgi:hypothetical protein